MNVYIPKIYNRHYYNINPRHTQRMAFNTTYAQANDTLVNLSQMGINNEVTHKLNFIARIYINGHHYFNVFRRYNSTYNFVLEDMRGELYCHKNHTIRKSLQKVLCINDEVTDHIYTDSVHSYKHSGPAPSSSYDVADMRWADVERSYGAISVNFKGILEDFHSLYDSYMDNTMNMPTIVPHSNTQCEPDIIQAATELLHVKIPESSDSTFSMSESDGSDMSLKWSDIVVGKKESKRHINCYCYDADAEEDVDENTGTATTATTTDSKKKADYTILRNGTKILKRN